MSLFTVVHDGPKFTDQKPRNIDVVQASFVDFVKALEIANLQTLGLAKRFLVHDLECR